MLEVGCRCAAPSKSTNFGQDVLSLPRSRRNSNKYEGRGHGLPLVSAQFSSSGGRGSQVMEIQMIRTDTVYQGWGRYLVVTVRMPDGQIVRREIEDHGSAAGVLPYDAERRTAILVRQFRAPAYFATRQDETLEAVAGIIDDPDPDACVRRESLEEAGLKLGTIEHVVTA